MNVCVCVVCVCVFVCECVRVYVCISAYMHRMCTYDNITNITKSINLSIKVLKKT